MTIFTIQTITFVILTIEKTILETWDIWDTDYNSDNWEPECYLTINCDTGQHSQFLQCLKEINCFYFRPQKNNSNF